MELRELLAHLGRRLWLLLIIPIAALLVVVGLSAPNGTRYSSSVDLQAVTPSGDTSGTTDLAAGSLINAVSSDDVVNQLAQAGAATADRVRGGISAARVGDTALVRVTFSDPSQDVVKKVSAAIPAVVQNAAFAPALRQAESAQTQAQDRQTAALAELDKVRKATKINDPAAEAKLAADEITKFEVALGQAASRGDSLKALQSGLDHARQKYDSILAAQSQFAGPQAAVDTARQELAQRTSAIADIKARQASTVAASIGNHTSTLPWYTRLVRRALTALLIGLAVALLLLAIPEVLRRSRREATDELYEPAADEIAWEQQGAIAPRPTVRSPASGSFPVPPPSSTRIAPPPTGATLPPPPAPREAGATAAEQTVPRGSFGDGISLTKPGE